MSSALGNGHWLGETPNGWRRSRIRNVAKLSPSFSKSVPDHGEPCAVVPMEMLSNDGRIDASDQQPFEEISSGLALFEPGDVLFAKITPCMENGKGAFVRELPTRYAFGSTEFHVLRPHAAVDGKFLYYATLNPVYRAYAAENMSGAAGQKRVSSRFLKDTHLFLPSPEQQRRIVKFLDSSCAAIDAAGDTKRQQIKLIDDLIANIVERSVTCGTNEDRRVRVAGKDWITALPEHWGATRIKRAVLRVDYGISVSTETEGKYPVLKMANLQGGEVVFSKMEFVDDVADDLLLEPNDVLYNRTNSPDLVGKAAIFRGSKDDGITFASYLVRLRGNHRVVPAFLNYAVNCTGFLSFARRLAIPSVQQSNLNSTRYCRMWIPLPPIKEQHEISEFLDAKLAELRRVSCTIQDQITILAAYRKSLIHECVTGQRRITKADLNRVKA